MRGVNMTLAVAASQQRVVANRVIEYDVQRPDFFVLSGTQAARKFYTRARGENGEVRGFTVLYDPALEHTLQPVIVAMSSAFAPFNDKGTILVDGAVPRRKVEYTTGVVVTPAGDILADRQATQGCQVIVVPPLGPAERTAEDAATGLSLLRIHGARNLSAAALAGEAGTGDALTLVGVADPQVQAGSSKVTAAPAHLTAAEEGRWLLKVAPVQGFSGAPALDGHGRFRGIVLVQPLTVAGPAQGSQAILVPADAVRNLLSRQKIASGPGRPGVANLKAAVVRVICVRP
jgi:hypothetical protein